MSIEESFWSKYKIPIIAVIIIAIVTGSIIGISVWMVSQETKTTIQMFHAGSLYVPIEEYQKEYEGIHSDIQIDNEAHGSATAIRQVTELGKGGSVVGSADYSLIYTMMMNETNPDTGEAWADWYVIFAVNQMSLVYIEENSPPHLETILAQNITSWELLASTDVVVGRADPYQDPCGYRTLMVWGLVDDYYYGVLEGNWSKNTINESFYAKDPISGYSGTGKTVVKGKETDLISSLEAGEIDYLFIYSSIAAQHDLEMIEFNDHFNLANGSLNDFYENVTVHRKSPLLGESTSDKTAKAIQYGLTVPNNAPYPDIGVDFVKFIIQRPGVMLELGQPAYYPVYASNMSKIPQELVPYCEQDPNPLG
ncbi:MAG: tungstate ABC transporter substrate-binding protein WtpA [Candidatus Lokiarchaeota archaeon]|nr:tungstate ABC transporter substrate-binding protein WtpA [Candidatus Lokiarchaeota archaeon]